MTEKIECRFEQTTSKPFRLNEEVRAAVQHKNHRQNLQLEGDKTRDDESVSTEEGTVRSQRDAGVTEDGRLRRGGASGDTGGLSTRPPAYSTSPDENPYQDTRFTGKKEEPASSFSSLFYS